MEKPSNEELSELIGLIYDSAFERVQWQSLLRKISQMYPGVGTVAWGYEGSVMFPEYSGGAREQIFTAKVSIEMKINDNLTMSEAAQITPNGFVARSRVVFDEDEYLNSELYNKYLKPAGLCHCLQLKVDHVGDRGAYLGFAFPDDKALEDKYHDSLFELTKLLAPHAVRASQLARALTMAKRATEVFSGFLDGILLPMLVTNESGRYLFANAAGRRLLKRSDPMKLTSSGDLVLEGTDDTRAFQRRILFVGQLEGDEISTSLLEDVFDMTPREAEVCSRLIQGMSAAEIAGESDRALKTVRNQIQVIHEKVGVTSNVALMETLSVFRTVGSMFDNNAILNQEEHLLVD